MVAASVTLLLITLGLQLFCDSPETLNMLPDGDEAQLPDKRIDHDLSSYTGGRGGSGAPLLARQVEAPQPGEAAADKDPAPPPAVGDQGSGGDDDERSRTLEEARREPVFWVLLVIIFLINMSWGGLNAHMKSVCAERGLPSETVSLIYTAIGASSFPGSLLVGWALDRARSVQHKVRLCVITPLLSATTVALAVNMNSELMGVVFGACTGLYLGSFIVTSSTSERASRHPPEPYTLNPSP